MSNKSGEKQTRLDTFIHKKKKKNFPGENGVRIGSSFEDFASINKRRISNQRHNSSRENSDTEPISEGFVQIRHDPKKKVCPPYIMIGPFDVQYEESIREKLSRLQKKYNREALMDYLKQNLKYHKINNFEIIQQVSDADFLKGTLPKMISLVLEKGDEICCSVENLICGMKTRVALSRQQILTILSCVFLGILPKNLFSKDCSFGHFMGFSNQKNKSIRRQKLLFIINYFKMAFKLPKEALNEYVTFQRNNMQKSQLQTMYDPQNENDPPLMSVEFPSDVGKIEEFYGNQVMIDFANKAIGGGVLRNGAVQEEILFLIFPEAIVSKFICDQMQDNESIVILGLRRFSNYRGYSYDTVFDGPYTGPHPQNIQDSVMVAVDAVDFSEKLSTTTQFSKYFLNREIFKMSVGLEAIQNSGLDMKVCTGKWGCGAFKGDEIWKFFIQWISCSQFQRQMTYLTDDLDTRRKLQVAVKRLLKMGKTVLDLVNLMICYSDEFKKGKFKVEDFEFYDYLTSYA